MASGRRRWRARSPALPNTWSLRRSNLHRRSFKPLLRRTKLPQATRFHDLRHTAGVHPKIVRERLGHSTVALTLDVCSHVLGSLQRDAADKLDEMLR